ncbi:hypothetical protein DVH26_20535 [Paenibacillus sp. H1-7]|nr:hypothetical protein DVH26_20535 [Paenibacillus sp. H1-7]
MLNAVKQAENEPVSTVEFGIDDGVCRQDFSIKGELVKEFEPFALNEVNFPKVYWYSVIYTRSLSPLHQQMIQY